RLASCCQTCILLPDLHLAARLASCCQTSILLPDFHLAARLASFWTSILRPGLQSSSALARFARVPLSPGVRIPWRMPTLVYFEACVPSFRLLQQGGCLMSIATSPAVGSWPRWLARPLDSFAIRLAVVLGVCFVLFFYGLGDSELWRTESLRAIIAQGMLDSG